MITTHPRESDIVHLMRVPFLVALPCLLVLLTSNSAVVQRTLSSRAWATRELLTAAWEGDRKAALKALRQGADVTYLGRAFDREGEFARERTTALIVASEGGDADLVRLLIAHGARLDTQDDDGNTALHQAAMNGEVVVARLLLDAGANYRLKNHYGNTPLMLDDIGDGSGSTEDYKAVARLIRRRMARDRIHRQGRSFNQVP